MHFRSFTLYLSLLTLFVCSPAWAAGVVHLQKTGQTRCYDAGGFEVTCAGTGQDGEIQAGAEWPSPRFVDNADGTVTDGLTGLTWLKNAGCLDSGSWETALTSAASLANGQCGLSDGSSAGTWRLPNRKELESLADFSRYDPALPSGHPFSVPGLSSFWSSTVYAADSKSAWTVSLGLHGEAEIAGRGYWARILPVKGVQLSGNVQLPATGQSWSYGNGDDGATQRGAAWPSPRFADNGDGTVTDRLTGLVWSKNADTPTAGSCTGGPRTWLQALEYVGCLNASGHGGGADWRLPNLTELQSLVHAGQADSAEWLKTAGFTGAQSGYYWSSTTQASSGGMRWWVFMNDGNTGAAPPTNAMYVWPVRGGIYTVPGAPAVGVPVAGNGEVTVPFSPPIADGGTSITSYVVTSNPGGITASGSASPITVSGLSNGTGYSFTVKAVNAVGAGPDSAASGTVTPGTVPGAPAIGAANAGNGQATVAFTAPASNGGSAITGYTVVSSPGGVTATGAASPITVTGLTNGTSYTFTVKATNAFGSGAPSAASNAVIPLAPVAVHTVTFVAGSNGSLTGTTVQSVQHGGQTSSVTAVPAAGYRFVAWSGVGGDITANPVVITNVTSDVTVTATFAAVATTLFDNGDWSGWSVSDVTGTTGHWTKSAVSARGGITPRNGSYLVEFNSYDASIGHQTRLFYGTGLQAPATYATITLTYWIYHSSTFSTLDDRLQVQVSTNGGTTWTNLGNPVSRYRSTPGWEKITLDLTPYRGQSILIGFLGISAMGDDIIIDDVSIAGGGSATIVAPGAPAAVTATAGNGQAVVSFTAPANTGGSAITGYTVTSTPGGITASGTASPITVTGLTNGTSYTFTVKAANGAGAGPASSPSNAVTPQPIATYTVTFVAGSNGSITGQAVQTVQKGGATSAVSAVPTAGYRFVNWSGIGGDITANPMIVENVQSNLVVTANFAPSATWSLGTYLIDKTSKAAKGTIAVTAVTSDPLQLTAVVNASSTVPWITVTGNGAVIPFKKFAAKGKIAYSIDANTSSLSREGKILVNGEEIVVRQQGALCAVSAVTAPSKTLNGEGDQITVTVTAPDACNWTFTISGAPAWISAGSSAGTGSSTVTLIAQRNSGTMSGGKFVKAKTRKASIVVGAANGAKTLSLSQAGAATAWTGTFRGVAAKGFIRNADVTLYSILSNGALGASIGSAKSGLDGKFSIALNAEPTPLVLVAAAGGKYDSTWDGSETTAETTLLALCESSVGLAGTVSVTPLSDMVANRTTRLMAGGTGFTDALSQARQEVMDLFGLEQHPEAVIPDFDSGSIGTEGYKLGLALTTLEVFTHNVDHADHDVVYDVLSADFTDGVLDAKKTGNTATVSLSYGALAGLDAKGVGAVLYTASQAAVRGTAHGVCPKNVIQWGNENPQDAAAAGVMPNIPGYSCNEGYQLVQDAHGRPTCWDGTKDADGKALAGTYYVCSENGAKVADQALCPVSSGYSCEAGYSYVNGSCWNGVVGGNGLPIYGDYYVCGGNGLNAKSSSECPAGFMNLFVSTPTPIFTGPAVNVVKNSTQPPLYTAPTITEILQAAEVKPFSASVVTKMKAADVAASFPSYVHTPSGVLTQAQLDAYSMVNRAIVNFYSY